MPEPGHEDVTKGNYTVTFHPAFASRCVVQPSGGAENELYRQQGTHQFPAGESHPKQHTLRLKGGPDQRNISLVVNDPGHQIARIVVELYAAGHQPGGGSGDKPTETFTVENDSFTCPPSC